MKTASDAVRTRFLHDEGYHVIRFANADVMQNLAGVIGAIGHATKGRP